jgi:hypothetical protein
MVWSPRARVVFVIAAVSLLAFLGLSLTTGNWRFFLFSIGPVIISLSTGFAVLTSGSR